MKLKLPRNWRSFLIIEEEKISKKEIRFTLKFTRTIKNIDIIGYLITVKKGKHYFVKIASVILEMRGLGCGSMLYEHAISKVKHLSTKYNTISSLAKKVWDKLIKKYNHTDDLFTGILTVYESS